MKIKKGNIIWHPEDAVKLIGKEVWGFDNPDGLNPIKVVLTNIEYRNIAFAFSTSRVNYRFIAPMEEPAYRPFKNAKEFRPYREKWIRVLDGGGFERVTFYNDEGIRTSKEDFVTYEQAFKVGEFEYKMPFGVLDN
jgi:hypothetical protein